MIYEDALNSSALANGASEETVSDHVESDEQSKSNSSNVLHIRNLTRPFTVPQLKELLTKFGPLKANSQTKALNSTGKAADPHYFWVNSVKSHCFVAFESEEDAVQAQKGLDQITWPQSNPKQLVVEMASMEDMEFVVKHNDMPSNAPRQVHHNGTDSSNTSK